MPQNGKVFSLTFFSAPFALAGFLHNCYAGFTLAKTYRNSVRQKWMWLDERMLKKSMLSISSPFTQSAGEPMLLGKHVLTPTWFA
jgi:hypothetical protein